LLNPYDAPALLELAHSKTDLPFLLPLGPGGALNRRKHYRHLRLFAVDRRPVHLDVPQIKVSGELVLEELVESGDEVHQILNREPPSGELLDKSEGGPKHALLFGVHTSEHNVQVFLIERSQEPFHHGFGTFLRLAATQERHGNGEREDRYPSNHPSRSSGQFRRGRGSELYCAGAGVK